MDLAARELGQLSAEHSEFDQRVRLAVQQVSREGGSVLQDLEGVVEELKVRREEVAGYKE